MADIGNRIKERRLAAGLSQTELGEAIGRGKSAVSEWEANKRSPDVDLLQPIADTLHTTIGYLMGWDDDPEDYSDADELNSLPEGWYEHFNGNSKAAVIAYRAMHEEAAQDAARRGIIDRIGGFTVPMLSRPLLGIIPCGNPIEAIQQADETVEVPASIHCDFCLRCKGDSMIGARIHDGDIVYIRIQPDVDSGEIAAVLNGDNEATLKRVRKGKNTITLWPENPNYEPKVYSGKAVGELRILGKAVGFTSLL